MAAALLAGNATSLFASSFSSLPETLAPVWLPPHAQDTLVDALEILNVSSKDANGKFFSSEMALEEWVIAVFGEPQVWLSIPYIVLIYSSNVYCR